MRSSSSSGGVQGCQCSDLFLLTTSISYNLLAKWNCKHGMEIQIFKTLLMGFPDGSVVKNLPANAGDTGDASLVTGSGRCLEEEMAAHSSILAGKIPWTEEPGGLQPMRSQKCQTRLSD
ncbi:unnamed protein product [Rangifer tarandus platyrhynchus]|uniref:Uncharacterized protein n=1 Tax=Rangifer tarandus platyrhynchus TaxID=3082113 RepID=A0ABN8ZLA3_RANTA|nr:unnamed protein product [Rangifer tarandus platyrhynchus]